MISHHTVEAEAVSRTGEVVALAVTTARVTIDEEWSPYCQADLIVPIADGVDPRQDARVRVWLEQHVRTRFRVADATSQGTGTVSAITAWIAGRGLMGLTADLAEAYNTGDHQPTRRRFDLGVRSREVDLVAGTMQLSLASDEALLQDYRLLATTAWSPGSTGLRAIVNLVLGRVLGSALVVGEPDGSVDAAATTWEPGQSAWDYLAPLVASAGLRLWCDEERLWQLGPKLSGTVPGLLVLTPLLKTATDVLARDETWHDGVIVRYRWTDSGGASRVAYDIAGDSSSSRMLLVDRDTRSPGAGAAAAMLAVIRARGRAIRSKAVSRYDVQLGQSARVDVAGAPVQAGTVSAVEWSLPADEMTVRTRDLQDTPLTAWLWLAAGIAWEDAPVGVSWAADDPHPSEIGG